MVELYLPKVLVRVRFPVCACTSVYLFLYCEMCLRFFPKKVIFIYVFFSVYDNLLNKHNFKKNQNKKMLFQTFILLRHTCFCAQTQFLDIANFKTPPSLSVPFGRYVTANATNDDICMMAMAKLKK